MKVRTLGLLAVGTVMLSVCAGMTLSAKDIEGHVALTSHASSVRPQMDLAFCIDTTGSMQGEIDMVKSKVKDLTAKLCSGKPAPKVRVGLVAFRDRGDEYVTKVYPFTDNVDKFVKDISELTAYGGGDSPESVNEALHVSVNSLAWDDSKKTAKLLFLIGDAGPHSYPNDYSWDDEAKKAIARGIQINTLACNGLESSGDNGLDVFQKIAKLTDGQFENLAYRQIVRDESGRESTVISSGGASYAVAEEASGDWKLGAKSLSAMGKARSISSVAKPPASLGFAERGGASSFAMGAVNRKDSNLDALMYDAAMKKARALKVSY